MCHLAKGSSGSLFEPPNGSRLLLALLAGAAGVANGSTSEANGSTAGSAEALANASTGVLNIPNAGAPL